MSTTLETKSIPNEVALSICQQIRTEHSGQWWRAATWQCWGCVKFSKGDPAKMCFSSAPGNRGCQLINRCYAQTQA